jgi:hypothetical protein
MTLSHTTKIEPSSIHSSSKNVWLACPSWTKGRPSSSRRKWTRGRRMRAKIQGRSHLLPIELVEPSEQHTQSTAVKATAFSVDLAVYFLATNTPHTRISPRQPNQLHLLVRPHTNLQHSLVAPAVHLISTWQTRLGVRY